MRMRAVLRLVAAILAFVLVTAACGDDTPTESTPADSIPAESTPTDSVTTLPPGTSMDGEHSDEHTDDHTDEHPADTTDMPSDGSMPTDHEHATIEITGDVVPTVALEVIADPAGGVNIHVTSTGIAITPEAASTEAVEGQGHYHLFLDGEKVLRFYNDWIYYAGVTEGEAEFTVELSANDHSTYTVDGVRIADTVQFTVPEHSHDAHSHDEAEPQEFAGAAPELTVEVVEDAKSGWNAFVTIEGLTLSPEHAGDDHVDGEGHLHIYANDQKLGRLYGLATHIPALPDGEVEITIAAYTNDHRPYVVDGVPVEASVTVTVAS